MYWSKIAIFFISPAFDAAIWYENSNNVATRRWKKFDNMFTYCDIIHERDGHRTTA